MPTTTLTFCDCSENHKGMEMNGTISDEGFSKEFLIDIQKKLGGELIDLKNDAWILIIRNGLETLIGKENSFELKKEQDSLKPDTKAFMYGRVVNKIARHNLCFSDIGHEPDYENKKGTVISYSSLPYTQMVRNKLQDIFGEKYECEANYYYNNKCGIGAHGDSERRKVIGVRLGDTMPLNFCWYLQNKPIDIPICFELNNNDMYVMSEKTVGFDWKKSSIRTLRHAAGAPKYLKFS